MLSYLTKWSLTRRKIFTNCARRFGIKYFYRSHLSNKNVNGKTRQSSWDLMIKSARKVFFERLSDLHKGIVWSEKLVESKMRFEFISNLSSNRPNNKLSNEEKNRFIFTGIKRIKRLMNQVLIRKISQGKINEWSYHDRIKPVNIGHIEVYCSPDLVYRLDNKWHLVRINFQAELNQPYLKLELCSMLIWSKGNQYLPNLEDKFVIHGLSFRNGIWRHKIINPTQKDLQETKQLLERMFTI